MKKKLTAITLVFAVSGIATSQMFNKKSDQRAGETVYKITPEDLSDQIPTKKKEAKESLKPYRYDASKVSYFIYKTFEQRKEVEVFFFSNNEYKLAFNPGSVAEAIEVKIYDKPNNYRDRTELWSKSGVSGGIFDVTSTTLLNNLIDKKVKVDSSMTQSEAENLILKKVYINYLIPAKEKDITAGEKGEKVITRTKGAMILSMGYKNV
jgi:hypothetical protein